MAAIGVNQPPQRVPQAFARDTELNDFFQRLLRVIFQLWKQSGSAGGDGGDTYITEVTNVTQLISEEADYTPSPAMFAHALSLINDMQIALSLTDAKLLAHIGALHQRINDMPSTPKVMALGDLITSITDASPDELYEQSNGTGLISAASAYNDSGSSVKLSVYILPDGEAAASVSPTWEQDIPANSSAILAGLLGQVVPPAGSIVAFAATTDVVRVTISGSDNV